MIEDNNKLADKSKKALDTKPVQAHTKESILASKTELNASKFLLTIFFLLQQMLQSPTLYLTTSHNFPPSQMAHFHTYLSYSPWITIKLFFSYNIYLWECFSLFHKTSPKFYSGFSAKLLFYFLNTYNLFLRGIYQMFVIIN